MNQSAELDALAPALVKAQGEFEAVEKGSENPFFQSKYADLATVVKAAKPILTNNDLAVTQLIGSVDGKDVLTTILLHKSGQYISDAAPLHPSKNDAQGYGSATTYQRRYSYMSILGLVADEDDDGNAASRVPDTNTRPAPQRHAQTESQPQRRNEPAPKGSILLNVPFSDKDEVKSLGARWSGQDKAWYVPAGAGVDPLKFIKWMNPQDAEACGSEAVSQEFANYSDQPF